MSQLESQMRLRDKEMVPRILVRAMFALMLGSVALVAYAQWAGVPNVGVLREAPVVAERSVQITEVAGGLYEVRDASGVLLASSGDERAGFIGVIGRVLDRARMVRGVIGNPPVRVVRRENGNIAILDPATDRVIELIGYGEDNVAAFAQFVD